MSESSIDWLRKLPKLRSDSPLSWFAERFGFLLEALAEGKFRRDAAIVPSAGFNSKLDSLEIDGGRDVKYVIVYAREAAADGQPGIQETVSYRRDVAGTELIYDLTGEFLQGKARPFVCDLRKLPLRVYAVLPFLIERLQIAAQKQTALSARLKLRLCYVDARDSSIHGKLPVFVGLRSADSNLGTGNYVVMDGASDLTIPIPSGASVLSLVARSPFTGDEWTLPLTLVSDERSRNDAPLTSSGLTVRHAPQPVTAE